jgi:hypothetical protein
MTIKIKTIIGTLTACYLAFGAFFGLVMSAAIPALNAAGQIYYALTWPTWFFEAATHTNFMPIAEWMFTFKDAG